MRFVLIFGPPAVGKMSVGQALEDATGIRLFHNHLSIEPVLRFFPFDSPAFRRLVDGFRMSLFREVADSDLPGLAFTFVWDLDDAGDTAFVATVCDLFAAAGADVAIVELRASLEARLARNRSAERLQEKPSKRDVARSEAHLLSLEGRHRLNSVGPLPVGYRHLVIDNTNLAPHAAAARIVDELALERRP